MEWVDTLMTGEGGSTGGQEGQKRKHTRKYPRALLSLPASLAVKLEPHDQRWRVGCEKPEVLVSAPGSLSPCFCFPLVTTSGATCSRYKREAGPPDPHGTLCARGINFGWAKPLKFREWSVMATSTIYGKSHTNIEDPDVWEWMSCFWAVKRVLIRRAKSSLGRNICIASIPQFAPSKLVSCLAPTLKPWRWLEIF